MVFSLRFCVNHFVLWRGHFHDCRVGLIWVGGQWELVVFSHSRSEKLRRFMYLQTVVSAGKSKSAYNVSRIFQASLDCSFSYPNSGTRLPGIGKSSLSCDLPVRQISFAVNHSCGVLKPLLIFLWVLNSVNCRP